MHLYVGCVLHLCVHVWAVCTLVCAVCMPLGVCTCVCSVQRPEEEVDFLGQFSPYSLETGLSLDLGLGGSQ